MKFQVICLLIYGIRSSLQLNENYYYNASTDKHFCCSNFEWTDLLCTECKIGTTTREDGGRCLPCKYNMYGILCSETCDCNPYERCDNEVGCISKSTESTVSVKFLNETVTGKQTNTLKDRSSIKEWIMYTLCISGLTALTVVVHLLHKKRKQRSLKLKINKEVVLESFQPTPCIGIYSEVDENPLIFDTTELNVASQASFRKSVDFISQGRQSIITEIEDEKSTGYLDVYFDMENDTSKIDGQIVHTESLSNISFNSDFATQDNAEYCKPYTIPQDSCQENSNACEVIVTVHQCIENSSPLEKEATSNIYPDMFQPIQTDKQIQRQANKNLLSQKLQQ